MNSDLICYSCGSNDSVGTVNHIPICKLCKEESQKQYKLYEQKKKLSPEINEIIENKLFLGNYDLAKTKESLHNNKISHILVCGEELDFIFPDLFEYEKLSLEDAEEQELKSHFQKAIDFIEKGERVFVHCYAGVSRSASITIAYVMYFYKWSYEKAFNHVKQRRNIIHPNERFISELKEFEKQIFS